ncbi:hypothetical protein D3C71_1462100 [compost metagenome]
MELISARSTSASWRGRLAASSSIIFRFFLFSTISDLVEAMLVGSFSVIKPFLASRIRARPPFVASFGMAILAPSFSSSIDLIFLEYAPNGST